MSEEPQAQAQSFTVPLPPSVNSLHRPGLRNWRPTVRSSVVYERWAIVAVRLFTDQNPRMTEGKLRVTYHVYVPDNSSDLDNRIKACQDLLNGRVTEDDRWVWETHNYKHIDRSNPRIEMTVEQLPAEPKKKKENINGPIKSKSKPAAAKGRPASGAPPTPGRGKLRNSGGKAPARGTRERAAGTGGGRGGGRGWPSWCRKR